MTDNQTTAISFKDTIKKQREHDRYVATETYVRDVLSIMGQHDDANDPKLVGRIAFKIIRALPSSPLRQKS